MRFEDPVQLGDAGRTRTVSAEGGQNIQVARFDLPGTASPNDRISASATIKNNRTVIAPTDPDVCDPPNNLNPVIDGLSLSARLLVDGREVDRGSSCVPGLGGENDISLALSTPNVQDGGSRSVPVTLVVEGGTSGNVLARVDRTVLVRSDAPEPGDPGGGVSPTPGEGPSGCTIVDGVNPLNDCSLDDALGAGSFALAGGFAVLLVLVLVLAFV